VLRRCKLVGRYTQHKDSERLPAGNCAQWYFADPALRSDGPTASIITFFSSGVRSRWPLLMPAEGGGASLDARGVCPVVHTESAKLTANGAIKLSLILAWLVRR
jgi:hypothetical protein